MPRRIEDCVQGLHGAPFNQRASAAINALLRDNEALVFTTCVRGICHVAEDELGLYPDARPADGHLSKWATILRRT